MRINRAPRRAYRLSRRALIAGFVALGSSARAEDYPGHTVRILVPYPAGSGPDQLGRLLARSLADKLGQPFIVDDRPGALGVVGTSEVARSKPDGYTLLLTTNTTQAGNVALVKDLPYDPVRDFAPIMRVVSAAMMLLVQPSFPANDIAGLRQYALGKAGGLAGGYGSAASQVSLAKLQKAVGADILAVPYSGIPPAVNDLLGGHIALTFADLPVAMPLVRSGKLKALGVTSAKRLADEPAVPAFAETFPGFEVIGWLGLVAPAGTPDRVVATLSDALAKSIEEPQVRQALVGMSYEIEPLAAGPFLQFIKSEIVKWKKDAADAGICV